jgi:thiosulfate dehydrogenase [quinone] large subunit
MWQLRRPDGTVAPGWYLVPLRLFLGVTFLYAGLQKLANPDFFHDSSPISIHSQLVAATHASPIHALISPLVHVSTLVGVLIALGELAVAAGTLLGLLTRTAAVGGLILNLMLFLTVSYHTSPYYTGADIVFVFAWTPLLLAGAAGAPAVDTWLAERARADRTVGAPVASSGLTRRAVVTTGAVIGGVAAGVVVLGGAVAALGRAAGGTSKSAATDPTLPPVGGSSTTSTTTPTGSPTTAAPTPKGKAIGPSSSVPVGSAASFTDPKSGDPAIVIHRSAGEFVAYDAICPHAGCTVAYQSGSDIIACPCHGSEFNPANGDVVHGPAATGLLTLEVKEGPNGDLYVDG